MQQQKPPTEVRPLYESILPVYVFKDHSIISSSNNNNCTAGESYNNEGKLFTIKITISCNSSCIPTTVLPAASSSTNSLLKKQQAHQNYNNYSSLIFTLTDDSDLYFLYTAQIDESAYRNMKSSQRIKTDFSQFTSHLENMFEMCRGSHSENNQDWFIKLSVHQGKGKAVLEIIYSDPFSESSKFHLELVEGSNEQKKEYLANQLRYWKQIALESTQKYEHCDSDNKQKLEHFENLVERLNEEKNSLLMKSEKEITSSTYKLKEEITKMKEKHLEEIRSTQHRLESEKKELEERKDIETRTLSQKLEDYRTQNNELMSQKFSLENDLRQLSSRSSQIEIEKKSYLEEITKLREQNRELDSMRFENEKKIRELETRVTLNEELMKEKGLSLKTLGDHLKEKEQQELSKSEVIAELKSKLDYLEKDVKEKSDDVEKCHAIIKKYAQRESHNQEKEHERKHKMLSFQHALKKKEMEKQQLAKTVEKRNSALQEFESNLRSIQKKLEEKENDLKEAHKKIEQNQFTIDTLMSKSQHRSLSQTYTTDSLGGYSGLSSVGGGGLNISSGSGSAYHMMTDYSHNSDRTLSVNQPESASKLDSFTNYYKSSRESISTESMSTPEKSTNFTFSLGNISPTNKPKSSSPTTTSFKKNIVSFDTSNKDWIQNL